MSFGARALIRLSALKHNFNVIRVASPGAKIMAVIKANAYGHGMVTVAQNLPDVSAFAVARVPEAIELRENGILNDIVLLAGVIDQQELTSAIELHDLWPGTRESSSSPTAIECMGFSSPGQCALCSRDVDKIMGEGHNPGFKGG